MSGRCSCRAEGRLRSPVGGTNHDLRLSTGDRLTGPDGAVAVALDVYAQWLSPLSREDTEVSVQPVNNVTELVIRRAVFFIHPHSQAGVPIPAGEKVAGAAMRVPRSSS